MWPGFTNYIIINFTDQQTDRPTNRQKNRQTNKQKKWNARVSHRNHKLSTINHSDITIWNFDMMRKKRCFECFRFQKYAVLFLKNIVKYDIIRKQSLHQKLGDRKGQQIRICYSCEKKIKRTWIDVQKNRFLAVLSVSFNMAPTMFFSNKFCQNLVFCTEFSVYPHHSLRTRCIHINSFSSTYNIFLCFIDFFLSFLTWATFTHLKWALNWSCHSKYGVQSITVIWNKKRCHYLIRFSRNCTNDIKTTKNKIFQSLKYNAKEEANQ